MCLILALGAFFPRIAVFLVWLARPETFETAFGSAIWPLVGIAFLPFTTLIYVLTWSTSWPTGWDIVFLMGAIALDVFHLGGTAYSSKSVGWKD